MKKVILFIFIFLLAMPSISSAQSFIINNKQSDKYSGGGAVMPIKKKQDFFRYGNQPRDKSKTYGYNKNNIGIYKSKKQVELEKKKAEEERQKRLKEWRERVNAEAAKSFEAKKKAYLEKLKREKEAKNRQKKNSSSMPKNYKKISTYRKIKSNKKNKSYANAYYNNKSTNSSGYNIMKVEKKPQYGTGNRPGLRLRY